MKPKQDEENSWHRSLMVQLSGIWRLTSGRDLSFQKLSRLDIVLWSRTGKKLIATELTVPWETRREKANDRKRTKYTELMELCRKQGWRTWLFPVEVGVRGFCAQSVYRLRTAVRTTGRDRRKAIWKLSQAAERALVEKQSTDNGRN